MFYSKDYLWKGDFDFADIDLLKDFPLITAGTGRGKTYFSIYELKDLFAEQTGRKIEKILLLEPLDAIKGQILNDYENIKPLHDEDLIFGLDDGIHIACFAQLSKFLNNGNKIEVFPHLIIVDECDCLIKWSLCHNGNILVWDWIKSNRDKFLFCGLTATPVLLLDYVSHNTDFHFVNITPNQKIKHKAKQIEIISYSTANTYLKTINPSPHNKFLVYVRSAKRCYELSQKTQNSGFIISPYNEKVIPREDKKLNDLMEEQKFAVEPFGEISLREYILRTHQLPSQVNILFFNDSALVGVNIEDENTQTIVAENADLAVLIQAKGRVRHDIQRFVAIYNTWEKETMIKKMERYNELARFWNDEKILYGYWLAEQENISKSLARNENLKIDILTYKDTQGNVRLNPFAKSIYEYNQDIYFILSDRVRKNLLFQELIKHSDNQLMFIDGQTLQSKAHNISSIQNYDMEKWLNKKLFKEDRDTLANEISVVDTQGHKRGWPTVKTLLLESGYSIKEGRQSDKRYVVITAKN